jgi:hypothetical protein
MGFWSKLFGKKDAKLDVNAVDRDGDGKVQDGTIWERPAELTTPSIAEVEKQVEDLLRDLFPGAVESAEAELAAKKAKRSEAAKKAAATRAAKKKAEESAPVAKKPAKKK